jgi:hypothetical protein
MKKEELTKLTVKELDQMCKEKDLPRYKGKTHLNKMEMINNLLGTEAKTSEAEEVILAKETSTDKKQYVENAEAGTIIAFRDKKGRIRSGKITENNKEKENLVVELKSGRKFYITYLDVIWVTSDDNKRWPKEVLKLLKESQQEIENEYKKHSTISDGALAFLKKKMMGAK